MTIKDSYVWKKAQCRANTKKPLRIAQEMLDRGLDRELVMMVTRLSPDDLVAQKPLIL